jgi:hypothetical protein
MNQNALDHKLTTDAIAARRRRRRGGLVVLMLSLSIASLGAERSRSPCSPIRPPLGRTPSTRARST